MQLKILCIQTGSRGSFTARLKIKFSKMRHTFTVVVIAAVQCVDFKVNKLIKQNYVVSSSSVLKTKLSVGEVGEKQLQGEIQVGKELYECEAGE